MQKQERVMHNAFDVAIVGYGPVGMAMAALLGQSGHRVVVLERYAGKYNLPRGAVFDDETMRTFAKLGIAERMLLKVHAQRNYEWRNGTGDLLIEHELAEYGRSGWAEWYMMYQPDLEDALDDLCQSLSTVEVRFGNYVTRVEQNAHGVTLSIEGKADLIYAAYTIACDGGNSFIRRALDIPMDDYGFSEPWMVCDFRLDGATDIPMARQVCDPAQPTSIISLGPKHHRFSFLPGTDDDPEIERQPDRVWRRVARYLSPDKAELIRATTYTFRSLVAKSWRKERIVLAGDAAHQMPPFLGQGMCAGIRDALNLSWKFDMILAGQHKDDLLDTYQSEREGHVRAIISKGIELGRVQTMRDPASAAARDAELIARRLASAAPEKFSFPPLGEGAFGTGNGAHKLMVQGFGQVDGRRYRFDELFGYGALLLARGGAAAPIDARQRAELTAKAIKVVIVANDVDGPNILQDVDGTYGRWFDEHSCDIAAIRPDFHVWGTAPAAEAGPLLDGFMGFIGGIDTGRLLEGRQRTVAAA